jgi:O-antigen/teichoic acid export membrane protein
VSNSGEAEQAQTPMRRLLGNFGYLLRGRGIAAVMLLAATALMARALGPAEFGIVVLIHTYAVLVRGLLNVKQFLAIVRWGVPALDANEFPTLRRLVSICWRLDWLSCISATVVALAVAPLLGPAMGLNPDQVIMLTAYGLVLLATGNRTAIGILRLYDRFDILGWKETIGPAIRLVGVLIAWWLESPMVVYVGIFAFAFAVEELYLGWFGRREYHRQVGLLPTQEPPSKARMKEFSGLRHFLWITYWQSNVDLIPKHGSILLAGFLLGPAEAGLLRLARQFSTLLSKPAGLIRQVIFPDLTRSWNQGNTDFKLIVQRTAMLAGGLGLFFVLAGHFFGEYLLGTLIGEEFIGAAPVLTLLLLASTFDLTAASLRSAAYAIGHAGKVLRWYALSAVVYVGLFILCTLEFGLIGSGVAACTAAALPVVAMAMLLRKKTHVVGA